MDIGSQSASYEDLCRSFRWQLAEQYNIGWDICGRWADDRSRFALYFEDESGFTSAHTFWDIQREANRLSNVLAALGTLPGDRVAIALAPCPQAAIAHVATYQMGALTVPLAPFLTPDTLEYRLGDSAAHLAIVDEETWPRLLSLRERLPQLRHVIGVGAAVGQGLRTWEELLEHASPRYTPRPTLASDPAMLLYASRASGRPRGVLMAQRTLIGSLSAYVSAHDFFPHPRDLFCSSTDWAGAAGLWAGLLPTWHFGMPLLAYRGSFDAAKAFSLIDRYGVRNLLLSQAVLEMMKESMPEPRATYDVDLRSLVSVGESIGSEIRQWTREKLGVTVNELFGQTETTYVAGTGASRWPIAPGSVRAYPGHRVAVVDRQGNVLPAGQLGELAVNRRCNGEDDPAMMLGYWQDRAATEASFVGDGWYLTGCLATCDDVGNFRSEGGRADVFNIGRDESDRMAR